MKCGGRLEKAFEHAVQLAKTASNERAIARSRNSGMKGHTVSEYAVRFRQDPNLAAEQLLREVDSDPVSFDAALYFVAERIRSGSEIPTLIRQWVASAMTGEIKRPRAVGKYKGATRERDVIILNLLEVLVEDMGLEPTSANAEKGASACHAVARGLWLLRQEPDSYSTIKRIWQNRKDLRGISVPTRS